MHSGSLKLSVVDGVAGGAASPRHTSPPFTRVAAISLLATRRNGAPSPVVAWCKAASFTLGCLGVAAPSLLCSPYLVCGVATRRAHFGGVGPKLVLDFAVGRLTVLAGYSGNQDLQRSR